MDRTEYIAKLCQVMKEGEAGGLSRQHVALLTMGAATQLAAQAQGREAAVQTMRHCANRLEAGDLPVGVRLQ